MPCSTKSARSTRTVISSDKHNRQHRATAETKDPAITVGHARFVLESSARNTGPISNTRSKSEHAAVICLYSCGDCARHAVRPKYSSVNTSAPPSDAPGSNLGVWISVKPLLEVDDDNQEAATHSRVSIAAWRTTPCLSFELELHTTHMHMYMPL